MSDQKEIDQPEPTEPKKLQMPVCPYCKGKMDPKTTTNRLTIGNAIARASQMPKGGESMHVDQKRRPIHLFLGRRDTAMKCIVGTWQDAFNYVRSHRKYLVNANSIIGKSHPRDFVRCLVDLYHWHKYVWTNNERFVDIFDAKDVIVVSGNYARPLSEHPDYGKHEMTSGEFWSVVGEDWVKIKLYSVGTWDSEKQAYTPQEGLSVPSQNVPWTGLLAALRELRKMGYSCHRYRDPDGSHDDNDTCVLVERTDGRQLNGDR